MKVAPPATYSDWLPVLDRFRDGDDAVIDAMCSGSLDWTNVVAERWTARFSTAFDARLQAVSAHLQRAMDRAQGDPFSISRAMLGARRALEPLRQVAALPCAPENVRSHFLERLAQFVSRTQESLEASAKRVRSDAILKAVRDNPLTAPSASSPAASDAQPPAGGGRRVLL
ncbi:MAG: hypothetical protein JOZ54_05825 [Acidobacteria bacterium]|nr:hypothetical protein [Acidobacteriota bacterium]